MKLKMIRCPRPAQNKMTCHLGGKPHSFELGKVTNDVDAKAAALLLDRFPGILVDPDSKEGKAAAAEAKKEDKKQPAAENKAVASAPENK